MPGSATVVWRLILDLYTAVLLTGIAGWKCQEINTVFLSLLLEGSILQPTLVHKCHFSLTPLVGKFWGMHFFYKFSEFPSEIKLQFSIMTAALVVYLLSRDFPSFSHFPIHLPPTPVPAQWCFLSPPNKLLSLNPYLRICFRGNPNYIIQLYDSWALQAKVSDLDQIYKSMETQENYVGILFEERY